ncbi:MAG: ABC transporter permease [Flavobacteriales bacterium]|nr:ABC transporter permease [Flavobacteriales bacterium]
MAKSKIGLIIGHEYLIRVRKKSFWLVGILTPLAIVAVGFLIGFLSMANSSEETQVAVYDQSSRLAAHMEGDENLAFIPVSAAMELDSAKSMVRNATVDALLVIPSDTTSRYEVIEKSMTIYYSENVPMSVQGEISSQVEKVIQDARIKDLGIDPASLDKTRTNVSISMIDISDSSQEKEESDLVQTVKIVLAFALCFLLYMFMVFSGNMVMTSTLEEKTNRIVEVIVSSVRPFDLMVGKIISSGLVAMTQVLIWAVMLTGLSMAGIAGVATMTAGDKMTEQALAVAAENPETAQMAQVMATSQNPDAMSEMMETITELSQIDFLTIGIVSLVFFLLGYLLYASLYAAVGAAVDSPNDAGQFVLPLTIPIIIALYCGMTIIDNPHGPVAFWLSMIPFTSPIVMMVRVPFGVPAWEIVLSAVLLLVTFLVFTWIAAKIYRIGLLMYGTKPTYKDLWKWIRQS